MENPGFGGMMDREIIDLCEKRSASGEECLFLLFNSLSKRFSFYGTTKFGKCVNTDPTILHSLFKQLFRYCTVPEETHADLGYETAPTMKLGEKSMGVSRMNTVKTQKRKRKKVAVMKRDTHENEKNAAITELESRNEDAVCMDLGKNKKTKKLPNILNRRSQKLKQLELLNEAASIARKKVQTTGGKKIYDGKTKQKSETEQTLEPQSDGTSSRTHPFFKLTPRNTEQQVGIHRQTTDSLPIAVTGKHAVTPFYKHSEQFGTSDHSRAVNASCVEANPLDHDYTSVQPKSLDGCQQTLSMEQSELMTQRVKEVTSRGRKQTLATRTFEEKLDEKFEGNFEGIPCKVCDDAHETSAKKSLKTIKKKPKKVQKRKNRKGTRVKKKRGSYVCEFCNFVCLNESTISMHYKCFCQKIPSSCRKCRIDFCSKHDILIQLGPKYHDQGPIKCYRCLHSFQSCAHFRKHDVECGEGKTEHPCTGESRTSSDKLLEGFVTCVNCNVIVTPLRENRICDICGETVINMKNHKYSHGSKRSFICHICSFHCLYPNALSRHLLARHGEKHAVCKHCGKLFKDTLEVSEHKLKEHIGTAGYVKTCHICEESFAFKEELKKHMKLCHNFKILPCDICGKLFYDLPKHIKKIHSKKDSKDPDDTISSDPQICEVCGKVISRLKGLQKHQFLMHIPIECKFCSETINGSLAWGKHKKEVHPDEYKNLVREISRSPLKSASKLKKPRAKQEKKEKFFICGVCDQLHLSSHDLQNHQDRCKGPYVCKVCGLNPGSESHMRKHIKTEKHRKLCEESGVDLESCIEPRPEIREKKKKRKAVKISDSDSNFDRCHKKVKIVADEMCADKEPKKSVGSVHTDLKSKTAGESEKSLKDDERVTNSAFDLISTEIDTSYNLNEKSSTAAVQNNDVLTLPDTFCIQPESSDGSGPSVTVEDAPGENLSVVQDMIETEKDDEEFDISQLTGTLNGRLGDLQSIHLSTLNAADVDIDW